MAQRKNVVRQVSERPGPGRKRGEYSQAERIERLRLFLHGRVMATSLETVAEELGGISVRQLRRDIAQLARAGHDIEVSVSPETGRSCVRLQNVKAGQISLTPRERLTLLAARRVFDVFAGTSFKHDIESIYAKLEAACDDADRRRLGTWRTRICFVPDGGVKRASREVDDHLNAVLSGLMRGRRIAFAYTSSSDHASGGWLEPWTLVIYRNGLYVLGATAKRRNAPERNGPRLYALERFDHLEFVRGDEGAFSPPGDFNVETYFHGAFGIFAGSEPQEVVVDFSPSMRTTAEARVWHRSQRFEERPDGGVRLRFDVGGLQEVKSWILRWGPHAKAIAPPELVKDVARELEEARGRYG